MRKPFIAGNWKMFKNAADAQAFVNSFKGILKECDVEVALCVPFTQLWAVKEAVKGTNIKLGAQNMHFEASGAYTGEISAEMLKEIGIDYCIIGHSERREYFAETDETVNKKLHTAFENDIKPILCVGESLEEREGNKTEEIIEKQITTALLNVTKENINNLVIAYEPLWAIGTGVTATPEQANETIGFIREVVKKLYDDILSEEVIIQYGGSVKPDNASDLLNQHEIDGALVGGASLKPESFIEIVNF